MIVVFALIVLLTLLIFWLLFVPVSIIVNTDEGRYEIRQPGIFRLMMPEGQFDRLCIRVFGISLPLRSTKAQQPIAGPEKPQAKPKRMRKKSLQAWTYLLEGLIKSLRLNRLTCSVDLNNAIWNAYMIPVCTLLHTDRVHLSANYTNRFFVDLQLQLRVYRVAWTFLNFSFKK